MPVHRTILALATVAVGAGLIAAGAFAPASGPPPVDRGYPPPGVTAIGAGHASILPRGLRSERKIRRAVAAASARAMPIAMASARRRAARMAEAAGMRIGRVWAVGQDPNVPYYRSGIEQGTFGPGSYCGRVRSRRSATRGRWIRTCRVPKESSVYLTVTFERDG